MTINLYAVNDPSAVEVWHFVYFHHQAEELADRTQLAAGWRWEAPDLVGADRPLPQEPGEYPCVIYGRPAIAVLDDYGKRQGRERWIWGRVALADDAVALAHARRPEDWR